MTNDATTENPAGVVARQRYLAILARATSAELEAAKLLLGEIGEVHHVRPAEVGMSMLRGRIGGTGDAFNLGEATVTRCALRVGRSPLGVGCTLGRERRKAELIALLDSLLQDLGRSAFIQREVVDVMAQRQSAQAQAARQAAESSKVEFFTFVRGAA
jgi:alpha-D-ribose 1-methylphosphonate 5-triphosphate synthase subunit PhnG